MSSKKDFKLNSDARKKINEQYFSEPIEHNERHYTQPSQQYPRPQQDSRRAVAANGRPVQRQGFPEPPNEKRARAAWVRRNKPSPRRPVSSDTETVYVEVPPAPKKKHPRLRRFIVRTIAFCLVVILINVGFLYYSGHLWFNEPRKRDYPVRGAVVDSDLGAVDWEVMSTQTISFVYIRATKGTVFVDEKYSDNRKGANKTKLLSGFYHEFDFSTDGVKQAENFIGALGELDGKLRPMVKVTRYGIYRVHMKDEEKVAENLKAFLDRIEEEYGRRCVIMCDSACYEKYIKPDFSKYTLWLMGHFREPDEEDTHWALWEFNPRVRSTGYENKKKYYALSVYRKDKDIANFKKNFIM